MAAASPSPSTSAASDDEEEEERIGVGGLYSHSRANDSASSLPSSVNALGSIALEGSRSAEKLAGGSEDAKERVPGFMLDRYRPPELVSPAHLPFEIISQILHILDPQDLRQAIMVCKTWCRAGVEILWHKLVFHKNPGGSLIKMLVVLSRKTPFSTNEFIEPSRSALSISTPAPTTFPYALFVKRINLTAIHNQLSDQILSRFAVCTRLERLTLTGSKQITDAGLTALISQTHDLVALDVSDTKIGDSAILAVAQNCPRLQGLNLTGCSRVTDASLVPIALNCRQMKRIKLMGLEKLTSVSVHALALFCPLLLEVDLANCPQAASTIAVSAVFRWVTQLRELKLNQCNQIWEDGFPRAGEGWALGWPGVEEDALMNRQGLEQYESQYGLLEVAPRNSEVTNYDLSTSQTEESPTWTLEPLRQPPDQTSFEHLRVLDLTAVIGLTDQALINILSSAPKIRNLCLAKCSHLTNRSLIRICDLGRYLHYLHLGHVIATNDETVLAIAKSCNRLRFIDLACCSLITDNSIEELSMHLPKLKRVGLVKVSLLTDRSIWALAKGTAPLERVHLSYCTKITLSSVTHLLRRLPGLTHVSLTGVNAFLRSDLQTYCREPPKDFNATQRSVFCVFSGEGVAKVRRYLMALQDSEVWAHVDSTAAMFTSGHSSHRGSDQVSRGHSPHLNASSPTSAGSAGNMLGDAHPGLSREQRLLYMARLADWRTHTARSEIEGLETSDIAEYRVPQHVEYQRHAMVRAQARMEAMDHRYQAALAQHQHLPTMHAEPGQLALDMFEEGRQDNSDQRVHENGSHSSTPRRHLRQGSHSNLEPPISHTRDGRRLSVGSESLEEPEVGPLRHSSSAQSLTTRPRTLRSVHAGHMESSPDRGEEMESPKSSDDERGQSPMHLDLPPSQTHAPTARLDRSRMSRSSSGSGLWEWWRASRINYMGSSSPSRSSRSPARQSPPIRSGIRQRTMDQEALPAERSNRPDDRTSSIWPWSR